MLVVTGLLHGSGLKIAFRQSQLSSLGEGVTRKAGSLWSGPALDGRIHKKDEGRGVAHFLAWVKCEVPDVYYADVRRIYVLEWVYRSEVAWGLGIW